VVLDQNGNTKAIYDYYPFGLKLRETVTGTPARYRFTGKELDEEAGLGWYYFGARYYDPVIGRWVTVDPVLGKGAQGFLISNGLLSVSPYNYALNRPTVLTDPDGECPICVGALIGAGLDVAGQFAQSVASGRSEFSFGGFADFVARPSEQGGLNLAQTLTSGAIGATGAGLSTQIGKFIAGTGTKAIIGRAFANAVGNAAVGAGVDKAKGEGFDAKKAGINLAGGAVGSVLGDAIIVGGTVVDDVIVLGGEALPASAASNFAKSLPPPTITVSPTAQATANAASNTLANSGNLVQRRTQEDKEN